VRLFEASAKNNEECEGYEQWKVSAEDHRIRNHLATDLVKQFESNLHLYVQQFPGFYFPTLWTLYLKWLKNSQESDVCCIGLGAISDYFV